MEIKISSKQSFVFIGEYFRLIAFIYVNHAVSPSSLSNAAVTMQFKVVLHIL